MTTRQEFPEDVKRVVAQRAAYYCSRPGCGRLTIGPHSDASKSLSVGIAAHIAAAAPGGPRYDPRQTEEARRAITNAIWLCHVCSDLVDKNETRFTLDELVGWKVRHEQSLSAEGGLPPLPLVRLTTSRGLSLPESGPATLTAKDIATYREHTLEVRQDTGRMFQYFRARIQFPEPIVRTQLITKPIGSLIECDPDRMKLVANASGGGSVTVMGGQRPAWDFVVGADKLPPGQTLAIRFVSMPTEQGVGSVQGGLEIGVQHHIIGSLQYELLSRILTREFFVHLQYDVDARTISSSEVVELEEAKKTWRVRTRHIW